MAKAGFMADVEAEPSSSFMKAQNQFYFNGLEGLGYFGIHAPVNGMPKGIEDFKADGLMLAAKKTRDYFKKEFGVKSPTEIIKTLAVSNIGALLPEVVYPQLIDTVKRNYPYCTYIDKITWASKTVHQPRRTSGVTPVWGAGDGAALTAQDQTFTEKTANMAYLYTPGGVAWAATRISPIINPLVESIQGHYFDHMKYKEQVMLRGFNTGTSNISSAIDLSAQSSNIMGLLPDLEDNSRVTDLAGARQITLTDATDIAEKIENNNGQLSYFLCDRSTYTQLRNEVVAAQRNQPNDPRWGFDLNQLNIDGVPVLWSHGLSISSGQKVLVGIDARATKEFLNTPPEYVDVAQQMADKKEFFYRNYFTHLVVAPEWCYAYVDGL